MNISSSGLALIRLFEGLRLEAYRNFPNEPWTIGYGHTGPDVTPSKRITNDEAEQLLLADVARFEASVRDNVGVPITQDQFDALVSLAYNIGTGAFERSTLLRKLNAGDYAGAANEFLRWNKVGDEVVQGLKNRRERERELFLRGMPAEAPEPPVARPQPQPEPTTPAESSGPAYGDFGQPIHPPREVPMPAPIATIVASAVVPELLKLLPWHKAEAKGVNVQAIQQAVIEAAKSAAAKPTLEEAASVVTTDQAAQQRFVQAVAVRWADIAPALQFEEQSRKESREFFDRVTSTGPQWRQVGFSVAMAAAAIIIVGIFAAISWELVFDTGTSQALKERLIDKWDLFTAAVVFWLFGSSVGSRRKDDALAKQER